MVLSGRRERAKRLSELLEVQKISCQVFRGGMTTKEYELKMKLLPSAQVIISTGKFVGEGFDCPSLDTLFITLPIAWKGVLAIRRSNRAQLCWQA